MGASQPVIKVDNRKKELVGQILGVTEITSLSSKLVSF
jgi:hypothetical protein